MSPGRARALGLLLGLALALVGSNARAGNPHLQWFTVATPHFRVHYHGDLGELAQRTASLAEAIRERLRPPLGKPAGDVTHILLFDGIDAANGSARAVPYNAVELYVSAPEEMSVLGDYDDWQLGLLTHEQTHVVHVDNISGPATILNHVLGKTYSPNQVQPRWILEGLAVAMESRLTSGGRLRSSLFDMYLRADVLAGNALRLDQLSHTVARWPFGDVWYLYGGKFVGWILDTYGPDTFAAVAADYGANLMPWGINRSIRRATGRTYPELYGAWQRSLERRYGAQAEAVRRRGLRTGSRLTHGARFVANPRFVPRCARRGDEEELIHFRDDAERRPGIYRLPLTNRASAREGDIELLARTTGTPRTASFDSGCGIVFDSAAPAVRQHRWDDLHRQALAGGEAPDSGRERWTTSLRARSPDVSPDGRRVVFVTNRGGTTTLRLADIAPEGGIRNMKRLVPSARSEQAFSPRFSPDGRRVAYGSWTKGGYRDVRVVDVATGSFFELSRDRALDAQPTWSPDGTRIFFSSDRTGISNIYAYDLGTGRLRQVTNVVTGAFMPEVSPDGRTLVYVGYSEEGFDLFSLPLAEGDWLEPEPYADDRPAPPPDPPPARWPVEPYDPLPTLRPHAYTIDWAPGPFGEALTVTVGGSDIARYQSFYVALGYHPDIEGFTGALAYSFHALPFGLTTSGFRSLAPRAPVQVADRTYAVQEEILGVSTAVSFSDPGEFDQQNVSLSYTASAHDTDYPIGRTVDPYASLGARPRELFLGAVRLGWSYNNVYRSGYSVSGERGFNLSVSGAFASSATGSQATLTTFDARFVGYALAPWADHHAFALALSGGTAAGSYPSRGYYYTGGFVEIDPVDAVLDQLYQGGFVLRGFPPGAFGGLQYNLGNLEYRFPIAWIDRGASMLPFYIRSLSGALFADYGGAYDSLDLKDPLGMYHLGLGGQLRLGFTLGYFLDSSLSFGWAKGFGKGSVPGGQTYIVAAGTF